jgi:hypothetical protein
VNKAMLVSGDWAFLAGMLSLGSANVFLTGQRKLFLSLHAEKAAGDGIVAWLSAQGRKFRVDRGRNSDRIRLRFIGQEAIKVLTKTVGRITCPAMIRKADLAFAYWRTMQKPGVRLPYDVKAERARLVRKFRKLKAS